MKKGDMAPSFEGLNQDNKVIGLKDFKGKKLILYFYPRDNTPGCTAEACNLNDNYRMWLDKGFAVVGVSPDPVLSHKKFAEKYGLGFDLISDPDHVIMDAYGTWGEKKNYGKTYFGVIRTTFVIGEDGKIQEIIGRVDTKNHTQQLLKTLNI